MRAFKLGCEREPYDPVGVKSTTFKNDDSGVLEKINKGRRSLNVSARIGIRKSGIDMMTFKLIFWVVLVPTVLSGSETWVMSAKGKET